MQYGCTERNSSVFEEDKVLKNIKRCIRNKMNRRKRIIIIGGITAGTAAAVKARRSDDESEIVIYEKDSHISYGVCGLPYFISGKIKNIDKLLINTSGLFSRRFNIDVKTCNEVLKILPSEKKVQVRDMESGKKFENSYDRLIVATGSDPIKIPIDGHDAENVFTLKSIKDALRLKEFISKEKNEKKKSAVIIGGGFIGLELIEAFIEYGYRVTIIEKMGQILSAFDREIIEYLENYLKTLGIDILKHEEVTGLIRGEDGMVNTVQTKGEKIIEADLVFFGIGVRAQTGLAVDSGIKLGDSGAIAVDGYMRTNIEDIFAAGGCCECRNKISENYSPYNLASIANRQGRAAGYNAAGGGYVFSGSIITSIIKVLDIAIGKTGLGFREALELGYDAGQIELHYSSHIEYYPGAQLMHCLTVYDKKTGKLLGMQAIGRDGIDKRIDIASATLKSGMDLEELGELDLSYQPAYGTARDALNILGMIGENIKKGEVGFMDIHILRRMDLTGNNMTLLDVRTEKEFKSGHIEGAVNISIDRLRKNIDRLEKDKKVIIYCRSGYRAYLGLRILTNAGFTDVRLLNGSYLSWIREL